MDIQKLISEEFDNVLNETNLYIDLRARNALQGLYTIANIQYNPYEHDQINQRIRKKNKERVDAGRKQKPEKLTWAERQIQRALAFFYKFAYTSQNHQMVYMYYDLANAFYNIRIDQDAFFQKVRLCYNALYAYYEDIQSNSIDNGEKYVEIYDGGNGEFLNRYNSWISGAQTQQSQNSGETADTGETSGQTTETPEEVMSEPEKQKEVKEISQEVSGEDKVGIDFYGTDWFGFGAQSQQQQQQNA